MEQGGVVYREDAPPPIATTAFRLTERGEQLKPVMRELGRYGVPLMVETVESDAFRSHWLALPAGIYLSDQEPRCTAHRN